MWRRATLAEYRKPQPDWEVLIDLDRIAWAILEPEGKISFIRKDGREIDPRAGENETAG